MKKIISVVTGILVSSALITCSVAYAWLSRSKTIESTVNGGAVVSYFEGGRGTENDPYRIGEPRHLYNLAWLQDMGRFDDKVYYFQLSDTLESKNNILDMKDISIPPIGTTVHPFTGVFDGNKKTISNLHVLSYLNDCEIKPDKYSEVNIGNNIGMFGMIVSTSTSDDIVTGKAMNFYIKDPVITTNQSSGMIGLIVGNLNGSLAGIGVDTGELKYLNTSGSQMSVSSKYTLIGNILDETNDTWINKPGGGLGDLSIIPRDYKKYSPTINTVVDCEQAQLNKDKNDGSKLAQIRGEIDCDSGKLNGQQNVYYYTGNDIDFNQVSIGGKRSIVATTNNTSLDKSLLDSDFLQLIKGEIYELKPTSKPNFSIADPKNCIWFRPLADGDCVMCFAPLSNGYNRDTMSVYQYRSGETNISQNKKEIEFIFEKSKTVIRPNNALYFKFHVEKGYDYVIGKGSTGSTENIAGFLYLKLAGTDTKGDLGELGNKKVLNVDYVDINTINRQETPVNVWDNDYKIHNVLIETKLEASGSDISSKYEVHSDGKVYYGPQQSGLSFNVKGSDGSLLTK